MKAKRDVALRISEKEQADKYDQDVANIAAFLIGMASKGSENDG